MIAIGGSTGPDLPLARRLRRHRPVLLVGLRRTDPSVDEALISGAPRRCSTRARRGEPEPPEPKRPWWAPPAEMTSSSDPDDRDDQPDPRLRGVRPSAPHTDRRLRRKDVRRDERATRRRHSGHPGRQPHRARRWPARGPDGPPAPAACGDVDRARRDDAVGDGADRSRRSASFRSSSTGDEPRVPRRLHRRGRGGTRRRADIHDRDRRHRRWPRVRRRRDPAAARRHRRRRVARPVSHSRSSGSSSSRPISRSLRETTRFEATRRSGMPRPGASARSSTDGTADDSSCCASPAS